MNADSQPFPTSKHFRLEMLAPGVYAAIHAPGGWAIGNAGIIDLGNLTLIFDTFLTPQAARHLRDAGEVLTGRPATAVINSHYHNDHIWGNQVFSPRTQIVSTTLTRELITTTGTEEHGWYKENSAARLAALQTDFKKAKDEDRRREIQEEIDYFSGLAEAMPTLRVVLPNLTFERRLVFQGEVRRAELLTYGGGHTPSDAFLYLPEEGILFLSDLLFIDHHPYLPDGEPKELIRILQEVRQLPAEILVPGHGPVGGPAQIADQEAYLEALYRLAADLAAAGHPAEKIPDIPVPGRYAGWRLGNFFTPNLQFLYKRETGKQPEGT